MTIGTVDGEACGFRMTSETRHADTADTVEVRAVTEGAGVLDITGTVVEGVVRSGPVLRMGIVSTVAAFAPRPADTVDTEVEARVAAGSARLAVAGLAGRQVGLGIGAVKATAEIAAVERVRCLAGPVRMTALTVEAGCKAAWRRLLALQVRTMAGCTRIKAICGCIAAMVYKRLSPT